MIQISVVICTYNRAELLKGALKSLVEQSLDPECFEIIIVDNVSTDNTPEVVKTFQEMYLEYRMIRVYEPRQGLGYARNTGFMNALGRYVAYIDDDALAGHDWLKTALEVFESVKPTPFSVGGPILPFYNTPKPVWFKDEYETRNWGDQKRRLRPGESFSGSNMIWRKEFLKIFDGFNVRMGIKGVYLSIGQETKLYQKIWRSLNDPIFFYSPKLSVQHLVPPHKMTVFYQIKRSFVGGQVRSLQYDTKGLLVRLRFIARRLLDIFKIVWRTLLKIRAHSYLENWVIEDTGAIFSHIGAILGALGLFIRVRQR